MDEISSRELWKTGSSRKDRESHSDNRTSSDPRLNLDILRLVCDCLTDVPDVLSFAITCSALTEDALRRRLRMAPVDLADAKMIDSFYTFIFSNQPSRAPYIYGLTILSSEHYLPFTHRSDFEMISSRLVGILEAAVHIQYLDFNTSIGNAVFDAVVKLTTVHELRILNDVLVFQEPLLVGLPTFRSPLRSLHITGNEPIGGAIPASFLHNCLSHLAPTLELLDLDDFPIDVLPSSVTTQFTAVRSLKFRTSFAPDCDLLGVLLQLFPNLDNTLELSLPIYMEDDHAHAFHDRCEEAQRRHCWSRLDRLVCNAGIAYLLALRCPIRRMDLEVRLPGATSHLAETLRRHCPPRLHVRISLYSGFGALDGLFPPEAADRLTHLVLFTDIGVHHGRPSHRRNYDYIRSNRFMNRLLRSIKHLRLTHLHVVFRYTIYLPMRKAAPDADSVGHNGFGDGMDLEVTKARLVDTMPTLRYLFLTTCGQTRTGTPRNRLWEFSNNVLSRWFASKAWRVVHDGEDLHPSESDSDVGLGSCVELSGEAAERIMEREELQLSRDEEYEVRQCADSMGS
ncbi:hypothetical protein GSI_05817 [Ganoderma sinense ZZ0214-1]|uniref:F-box domain-containing protein n=1 Tax=Ganoderma sinense ZZ0214-1 TaxID=1077348 RepID=A0A2G8SBJ5_9APHY|nr:hypothetical protein GSI_05817 [Ganoderma sinense ZZ0214-1]